MQSTVDIASEARTRHLLDLAMNGLQSMYIAQKGLFCFRLRKTSTGIVREGISHRYTMMTLLGLLRAESAGVRSFIDIEAALARLLTDTAWLDNIGDLGLLLWLCAAISRKQLKQFFAKFDLSAALEHYPDARQLRTMELSWFLTGLTYAAKAEPSSELKELADKTYRLAQANQGPRGLFGHMAKWHSFAGLVRSRIGSFADQVYPILAMALFSQVFDAEEARDHALRCAEAACRLQGPLGQWWWHYDSVTGRVVERYPVYSVHQHAMAPMALFELQDTGAADFLEPIRKGLAWVSGHNELQQDFEDRDANVIWRCVLLSKQASYCARLGALLRKKQSVEANSLRSLFECRPYELGWLLYALAGRDSQLA
jgi:hypothetical protein